MIEHPTHRSAWPGRYACAILLAVATGIFLAAAPAFSDSANVEAPAVAVAQSDILASDVLDSYESRLAHVRQQIPAISKSAFAIADHMIAHPDALLNPPYGRRDSLSQELVNRAGGLAHAYPTQLREERATPHDVALLAVRSWAAEREEAIEMIKGYKEAGSTIVLFASKNGMPASLEVDYLIDNGAPDGRNKYAAINSLVNITNAWMWCCEYASGMTQHGKMPAVLITVATEEGKQHNRRIQSDEGRYTVIDVDEKVPAGKAAGLYLDRVEQLVADIRTPHVMQPLDKAATLIADRLAKGEEVYVTGIGHFIKPEFWMNREADLKPVSSRGRRLRRSVGEGDLVLWIGYKGINSAWYDYRRDLVRTGATFITCIAPDANPENNLPEAAVQVDQMWDLPDAEVTMPGYPDLMGPVSGINAGLMYRMIDERAAAKLAAMQTDDAKADDAKQPASQSN